MTLRLHLFGFVANNLSHIWKTGVFVVQLMNLILRHTFLFLSVGKTTRLISWHVDRKRRDSTSFLICV